MCRLFLYSLVLTLLLTSLYTLAKPLWDRKWIEVRTPNFIITSNISEKDTKELALNLENFRLVATMVTNIDSIKERIPIHIYLLSTAVPEIGLNWRLGGSIRQSMRGNYVVMRDTAHSDATVILQHEYTHFLTHNKNSLEYPPWFDEGFAELLSTVKVKGNKFYYGDVPKARIDWLNYGSWGSFSWLVNVKNASELSQQDSAMFYAQSWALVHYLNFGRKGRDFGMDTIRYLELLKKGVESDLAFEQAYDEDLQKLKKIIQKYLRRKIRYFKITIQEPFPESEIEVQTVSPDKIAVNLGHLCLINDEKECAEENFNAALKFNPDNADALTGLADIYKFSGRYTEAEPLYAQAIKLEPDNALHELDYAEYFHERARGSRDGTEMRQWLEKARVHYQRSQEFDGKLPETLAMYGSTYLMPGEDAVTGLGKLILAHKYLPSDPNIKLLLAQAYVQNGFQREGKKLLHQVLGWSHSGASEAAEKLLIQIDPDAVPGDTQHEE